MKNLIIKILLFTLPINLFGQISSDTSKVTIADTSMKKAEPVMLITKKNTQEIDYFQKATIDLKNAGMSYHISDNLIYYGTLATILGAMFYNTTDNSSPKIVLGIGIATSFIGIIYKYNGHNKLIKSANNFEKYIKK